ncbi:MAG: hypothetical protein K0R29_2332 [Pseudobdellovibrio sp.]|nr:hypothetical protein [Pseudobdellovibrio sp.]
MKSVTALALFLFSFSLSASELPVFPDCYRGTMTSADGSKADVFVSFSSVEGKLVRVQSLKIGNYDHTFSGTLVQENSVTFNSNDDYIPGGNASFNIDIKLDFSGNTAVGSFKEYRLQDGRGGYAQSPASTLTFAGDILLKKCRVKVVDL